MALNEWYKGVKEYIWPTNDPKQGEGEQVESEQMGRLTRLKRLSQLLESSNYSAIQQQQICMFYGSLIDDYPQTKASKLHPQFLYQPQVYSPRVNFNVQLRVKTAHIYCQLDLVVVFREGLAVNLPEFYIRNPDFMKYKPRDKVVRWGKEELQRHKFQAVFGGIRVLIPEVSGERWAWTSQKYYKQQNVLNMVRWIHKQLLLDCFPFTKRKTPLSTDIYAKARQLRDFIEEKVHLKTRENDLQEIPLLQNIQSANSLLKSIEAETATLKEDISQIQSFISKSQSFSYQQFIPCARDKKSEIILDSLSSLQACKDVQLQIEKQFLRGKIDIAMFKNTMGEIFGKKFDEYFLLSYWKSPQLL